MVNNGLNNNISYNINLKGLKNLGTTCYINSIIQMLFHIDEIKNFILNLKLKKEYQNVLYSLYITFFDLNNSQNYDCAIDTTFFVENFDIEKINKFEQKDVHEFLLLLIEKLENRLKIYGGDNLFKNLFLSTIKNYFECQCNKKHHFINEQTHFAIELEIKDRKNIYESLNLIIDKEYIDDDNRIFCSKCMKKRNMYKSSKFTLISKYLIFVLKRFEFSEINLQYNKIYDYYEFPNILDMSKYYETDKNTDIKNKYILYGVIIHKGLTYSGHYYYIINDINDGVWIKLDDSKVEIIDDNEAKEQFFGSKLLHDNLENIPTTYMSIYKKIDSSNSEKNNR